MGPNGYPIIFTKKGDKAELIPDEENPGEFFQLILRRNDTDILEMYNECWDKVWWNRHQVLLQKIERGEEKTPMPERAFVAAQRIEDKYGVDNLLFDDVDWGIIQGKLSALSWVMGSEWEGSMDT